MPEIAGIQETASQNGSLHLTLTDETTPQDVLIQLVKNKAVIEQFEIATPGLDEIFIKAVSEKDRG